MALVVLTPVMPAAMRSNGQLLTHDEHILHALLKYKPETARYAPIRPQLDLVLYTDTPHVPSNAYDRIMRLPLASWEPTNEIAIVETHSPKVTLQAYRALFPTRPVLVVETCGRAYQSRRASVPVPASFEEYDGGMAYRLMWNQPNRISRHVGCIAATDLLHQLSFKLGYCGTYGA